MSGPKKVVLILLGALSAILIVAQLVLGLMIRASASPTNLMAHKHLGYSTVAVVLTYVFLSLSTIAALPTAPPRSTPS
jgi:hypothetical protein